MGRKCRVDPLVASDSALSPSKMGSCLFLFVSVQLLVFAEMRLTPRITGK